MESTQKCWFIEKFDNIVFSNNTKSSKVAISPGNSTKNKDMWQNSVFAPKNTNLESCSKCTFNYLIH